MTGGGFGGSIIVLVKSEAVDDLVSAIDVSYFPISYILESIVVKSNKI